MSIKKTFQQNIHLCYSLLLVTIAAGAYYYCFDSKVFLGGDNVSYYNLGKAISTAQGYVNLNQPGLPQATHFPPGYPSLIAVGMLFGLKSITAVKLLNGLFYLGSAWALFKLFKKLFHNVHASFAGSLLFILNPVILKYSDIMMSELSFLFFTVLTLLLFVSSKDTESPFSQPLFYGFILCLAISYHIKSLGIGLLAGFILYFLYHKNWKWLFSTVGGFTLLGLPWFIRSQLAGGGSYIHQLLMVNPYRPELGKASIYDLAVRMLNNLQRYVLVEIPHGLFPVIKQYIHPASFWGWAVGLALCLLIGWGVYKLKNYSVLISAYLISTMGILLLWPSVWFGPRFMVALLPIMLFCCTFGLYHLFRSMLQHYISPKKWHPIVVIILALTFLPGLKKLSLKADRPYPKKWNSYIQIAKWTRSNTSDDVIISCRKPAIFNLFSNRKTFRFKDTDNKKQLIQDLEKNNTDYVVLDRLGFSSTARYLYPAIKEYDDRFSVILKGRKINTYLLKFQPDSTRSE